jgi:hypothetical protein
MGCGMLERTRAPSHVHNARRATQKPAAQNQPCHTSQDHKVVPKALLTRQQRPQATTHETTTSKTTGQNPQLLWNRQRSSQSKGKTQEERVLEALR